MTKQFCAIALLLAFGSGCSGGNSSTNSDAEVRTTDLAASWNWSDSRVRGLVDKANRGDIEAARSLYGYYSAHEDAANVEKWENWLIARGDAEALGARASYVHSRARNLHDGDPQKLILLKETEALTSRLLNSSSEVDESDRRYLRKVREEISALEALQAGK